MGVELIFRPLEGWPRDLMPAEHRKRKWSERPDNPGMSVTNAAEVLATRIADALGLGPEDAVFVEHYPAERGRGEPGTRRPGETWDRVTFRRVVHMGGRSCSFEDPSWRPMADADWRALGTHPSTWELQEA